MSLYVISKGENRGIKNNLKGSIEKIFPFFIQKRLTKTALCVIMTTRGEIYECFLYDCVIFCVTTCQCNS